MRIETVRARLTLWYVSVLAVILLLVSALIYVLLAGALYTRIADSLQGGMQIAMTSLANDPDRADLTARLPVVNSRDELGHLAETFNDLLARLEASMVQQRQFMATAISSA